MALVFKYCPCHRAGSSWKPVVRVSSRRMRWLIPLVTTVLAIVFFSQSMLRQPPPRPSSSEVSPAQINWERLSEALIDVPEPRSDPEELLQVGGYVTNLSDLDLLENRYSIELLLWTLWSGEPELNPSDTLSIVNGIYDGDIQRFERVRQEVRANGDIWTLYRVRTQAVQRWRLERYPFDSQSLRLEIGFSDPFQDARIDLFPSNSFSLNPGLILPGWLIQDVQAYPSKVALMSGLGYGEMPIIRQQTVIFEMFIDRISLLWFTPDFLGYILAVGLCCMSLLISRSRDDLILAAVVSAGGNYVFIAGKLPVTAMSGFIGNLQIIIFVGILYVVAADELIDHHLSRYSQRISSLLRLGLLPSYLAFTLFGVYLIIPSG